MKRRVNRRAIIAVVGDASLKRGSPKEALARDVGRRLVDAGYRILTGGLGGVMEAVCKGARHSARYKEGDIVGVLPGHDPREANPYVDVAIATGLDHVRNAVVAHADALVAIGGGAGTLSEISLAWIYRRLIIALRVDGWSGRVADQRLDDRVRYKNISEDCIYGADTPTEILRLLRTLLPRYDRQHNGIPRHRG
jgi:hypothetical protein